MANVMLKRKNNLLKLAGFAIILTPFVTNTALSQRLTLEESIQRALEVSPELQIAREEVKRAEFATKKTVAGRLPQLDFRAQYIYTSEVMKMVQPATTVDLGIMDFTIPGQELSFGDEHTADFKLLLTQPIFTGFGLQKAHRVARIDFLVKEADLGHVEREIGWKAEETYTLAQKASAISEAMQKQVDILVRHYADAVLRVQEGVAPLEVSARAELSLERAHMELQSAQRKRELAFIALKEMLDLTANDPEPVLDQLSLISVTTLNESDVLLEALNNRPELEITNLQKDILNQLVGVQQASYYPSLIAFGALNYGRPGIDRIANDWVFYQTAGISLNWTLWDWNKRSSQVQQARISCRQLDENRDALESKIRIEVHLALRALDDAEQRLQIARKSHNLSHDILGWVQERYNQGTASETEFLDAVDDFNRYKLENVVALADYQRARVQLSRACGTEDIWGGGKASVKSQ